MGSDCYFMGLSKMGIRSTLKIGNFDVGDHKALALGVLTLTLIVPVGKKQTAR